MMPGHRQRGVADGDGEALEGQVGRGNGPGLIDQQRVRGREWNSAKETHRR